MSGKQNQPKITKFVDFEFFDACEFCFDAGFDVPFFCQDFDFPRQGKSIHSQKNGRSKLASKQNSRASKKFKIIKFCHF